MGKERSKTNWKFSRREIRAVLLLMPLLVSLVWLAVEVFKPRFDDSAALLGDTLAESVGDEVHDDKLSCQLFAFDPNTVTYEELRVLGVPKNTAAGILRYREAGKVFRIPEDFAACYGVSDSMYAALKPYVVIGEEYRVGKKYGRYDRAARQGMSEGGYSAAGVSASRDVVVDGGKSFDPNTLDAAGFVALGFSPRQADVIIKYRHSVGGFRSAEDFAKSYVVSDKMFTRLKSRIVINRSGDDEIHGTETPRHASKVDINSADSAALIAVRGIGAKSVAAIIAYRKRLGGYHDIAQICETGVVTERNWEMIREQICADSSVIQKIDINFATPNAIARHPYIGQKTLRKLLRNRQLKGGWSTIEDMITDNTLIPQEAEKLAPYLQFRR